MQTPGLLPECGNFADNLEAFSRAVHALQNGQNDYGIAILRGLYAHILATHETKSVHWLLTHIEVALLIESRSRVLP